MKALKIILLGFLIFLFSATRATEFFVTLSGSDNNNGTKNFPFKSIFKASEFAMPGDTVTILGGEYELGNPFRPVRSGTPDKWILYRAAPNETVIFDGSRIKKVIKNNHVHHCFKEGIDCKEVSQHGVIHNNLVHDLPRQAYYADAWFGLLQDVEFHSNTAYNCMWGFAISVEGKGSEVENIRFHHNLIYNMKGAGVLFGMWGNNLLRSDIHIYNNTFYRCGSAQVFSGGVGSIDILSKNFRDVFIYRNICDKGWDYEMGFTFTPEEVENALKERNFIAAENLFESAKNRPSRIGQFDVFVYEYLPPQNQMGAPLYRNELAFDFVPEQIPEVKSTGKKWNYEPSPWFGAFKPIEK